MFQTAIGIFFHGFGFDSRLAPVHFLSRHNVLFIFQGFPCTDQSKSCPNGDSCSKDVEKDCSISDFLPPPKYKITVRNGNAVNRPKKIEREVVKSFESKNRKFS